MRRWAVQIKKVSRIRTYARSRDTLLANRVVLLFIDNTPAFRGQPTKARGAVNDFLGNNLKIVAVETAVLPRFTKPSFSRLLQQTRSDEFLGRSHPLQRGGGGMGRSECHQTVV